MILPISLAMLVVGTAFAGLYSLSNIQRRLSLTAFSALVALFPLAVFILLTAQIPLINAGETIAWSIAWIPSLKLTFSLYLDGLSSLFGLLVSGIGTLVVLYSGFYFKGETRVWRFLTFMLFFMTAMLGLVLAGDLITLFIFWEATSIFSFLLIGYKYKDETARRGAFKAFLITAGGGVFLLVGFLLVGITAGGMDFRTLIQSTASLHNSPLYPLMLGLLAIGAFTKSAQAPFHIWLPDAMSAPTPASAFLHSATMVKAGIYLLARLNPALGGTEIWFWLFSMVGLATMLIGAYLGLKQTDLKALLAYSTIAQLGVLVMLIGQDTEIAFKALILGILAHALYKSALFLVAGIVDHETGTRDLRELGGLKSAMPATFVIAGIAGLSMAGLPPLFGFLAKETLLATVTHPSVPVEVDWIMTLGAVLAGALLLAQSGVFVVDTFLGKPRSEHRGHEPPLGMLIAPLIPAAFSLMISIIPEPAPIAKLLANAAQNAYGDTVKVSFALWTGLTIELVLSILAVSLGITIFMVRRPIRALMSRLLPAVTINWIYDGSLKFIDQTAALVLGLQSGLLRHYISVILASLLLLLIFFGRLPFVIPELSLPAISLSGELAFLRLFSLSLAAGAGLMTILLRRDFSAILALGACGLSVAVLMILEPAPDVALVQIIVDLLTVSILVLTLARIPRKQRERASEFTYSQARLGLVRDAILAGAAGFVVAVIALNALLSRPRTSIVSPYYAANAKQAAGATDIVSAIVVDFRGGDTLIEIVVFAMIGVGIYTLLRYASRYAKDRENQPQMEVGRFLLTSGIGGILPSPLIQTAARIVLPIYLMIAFTHLMYGHDQPGDGFTAGVISGLGLALWYVLFGYNRTKRYLHLPKPTTLVGAGILLAIVNSLAPLLLGRSFFERLDYGSIIGLSLPTGFSLSTSFFFESSIFLAVFGGILAILDALGHPQDDDPESIRYLQKN